MKYFIRLWYHRPCRILLLVVMLTLGIPAIGVTILGLQMQDDVSADLAIVLGGKIEEDGTPSRGHAQRLDKAAELYHAGRVPRILVSSATARFDEAAIMRDYLVQRGVPSTAIEMDPHGFNTRATVVNFLARQAKEPVTSIIVVSQYYHLPRILFAFSQCGRPVPIYAVHPRYIEWYDIYSILRESVGIYAYAMGRKCNLPTISPTPEMRSGS